MTHRTIPADYQAHHARDEWSTLALLEIAESAREIAAELRRIRVILHKEFAPHLTRLELTLMPKTVQVGQTATAHITATKADGTPFPITSSDTLTLAAATAADVTFGTPTFNADGSADVVVTAVNADPGDAITATLDGVASNSDTLTITAAGPATVTLALQ